MASQLFGWQGFSLTCNDDFFPEVLSGDRSRGYVKLSSAGKVDLHIRWDHCKQPPDLGKRLGRYISILRSDSKRRRLELKFGSSESSLGLDYEWSADRHGRGTALYRRDCSRLFLIEWSSSRKAPSQSYVREGLANFKSTAPLEPETWSIAGLGVRLPRAVRLKTHRLMTGKTQVQWIADRAVVSAGRSAFGRELMGKMELAEWARAIAPRGEIEAEGVGVRIRSSRRTGLLRMESTTLAKFDAESNQLLYLSAMYRRAEWEPQWDWFL